MRNGLRGGLLGAMLLLTLGACTVKESDGDNDDTGGKNGSGGGNGSAGNGGNAGNAGNGNGNAGAPPVVECGDTPASGRCVNGNRSVEYCRTPPPSDETTAAPPPTKETVDCAAYEACGQLADGSAACTLDAGAGIVCRPGSLECRDDVLRACNADGKGYADTDCAADGLSCRTPPGKLAQCVEFASAGGTDGFRLTGKVSFQRRGMSQTGPSDELRVDPAWLDFVAVYNGDKYIGSDITDEGGNFDAQLIEAATPETTVYLYAMDFVADTQQPLVAIVHNDDPNIETQNSKDYWFWSNKDFQARGQGAITVNGQQAEMAEFTITEQEGSGALRIFQWIRYGMLRLDDPAALTGSNGLEATKAKRQQTIAVFWEPGVDSVCGACFLGPQGGGANVTPANTTTDDHYDTLMQISGSNANPTHWSYSVLSHELGHWTMANYSRSPGEGGQHFVGQASKPGLAWSEGWATAFGQWNSSDAFNGDYDPVYYDTQDGTTFWVNIATASYTNGPLQKPDPEGPIEQFINENVVSSMVWHLWQPEAARFQASADNPGGNDGAAYAAVGDEGMFKAVQSRRLVDGLNRGYQRIDLVDFYDATSCEAVAPDQSVVSVSRDVGFPWDSAPICP